MKSKSGNSLRSVLAAYCVDCTVIYVSVLLLYSDYQCNPFSCGAAKGVFGIAGHPSAGKFKECGK